jgi:hypothetical protein
MTTAIDRLHQGRPYQIVTETVEGQRRYAFRIACGSCPVTADANLGPECPPDAVLRRFAHMGWIVSPRKARDCRCPGCAHRKTDSRGTMTTETKPLVRQPTVAEMGRITRTLHEVFDEGAGAYLDGATDATVAERLGFPRAMVEQVREAIGFKIKVDPEIAKLKGDVAAIESMLAEIKVRLAAAETRAARP